MAVPIDKEMRERAKRDDKYLFQVSLDPKYLSDETRAKFRGKAPTGFMFAMSGPLGPAEAVVLWKLIKKWQEAEKV